MRSQPLLSANGFLKLREEMQWFLLIVLHNDVSGWLWFLSRKGLSLPLLSVYHRGQSQGKEGHIWNKNWTAWRGEARSPVWLQRYIYMDQQFWQRMRRTEKLKIICQPVPLWLCCRKNNAAMLSCVWTRTTSKRHQKMTNIVALGNAYAALEDWIRWNAKIIAFLPTQLAALISQPSGDNSPQLQLDTSSHGWSLKLPRSLNICIT